MEKIKTKAIIEIMGAPKEHVEETMKKVVELLKEKDNIDMIHHELASTKELEKIWSTFGEFELDFKDIDQLTDFCFEFMPSSIEIIEPEDIVKIDSRKLESNYNDILAKLHQYDMALKKVILKERQEQKLAEKR